MPLTLPLLGPGIFSGGLFAFLLSWVDFPISLYTAGIDTPAPMWMFSKMAVTFTPSAPALGFLVFVLSIVVLVRAFLILFRRRQAGGRASRQKGCPMQPDHGRRESAEALLRSPRSSANAFEVTVERLGHAELSDLMAMVPYSREACIHSTQQHERIASAIAGGDAARARNEMCEHVFATASFLKGLSG